MQRAWTPSELYGSISLLPKIHKTINVTNDKIIVNMVMAILILHLVGFVMALPRR